MAPILIDNRDLTKLGLTAVLIIVLAFAGGYHFGYYQATMGFAFNTDNAQEVVSAQEQLSESSQYQSDGNIKHTGKSQTAELADSHQPVAKEPVKPENAQKDAGINEATRINKAKLDQTKKAKRTVTGTEAKHVVDQSIKEKSDTDNSQAGQAVDDKVKFSVQVAVYGRLDNAEKMMNSLHEKGLDAYVSDYTNKKNKRWFNVRFGYFKDKKSANKALKQYINNQHGDGYLVNFSQKNIVSTVKEKPVNSDEGDKRSDDSKPSLSVKARQIETTAEKETSRLDNTSDIKTPAKQSALNKITLSSQSD